MDIVQLVATGIVGAALSLTLRRLNPEASLLIGITTGILIFFGVLGRLSAVLELLSSMTDAAGINTIYVSIIMKVIGIAYIAEFGVQVCRDAGEGAIASRIELAGKVLIMTVSAPVIIGVMDMITTVLP